MAFKGNDLIRSKTIQDNRKLEQRSNLYYAGCDISYDRGNKIANYQMICGEIRRTLCKNETKIL